ncbi:MAG TPA: hypothetical protein VH008_28625 [Pseudonocardia sp.]|jgi:hypothetical protein|nr:hypothetical protein [Pseudonocardia sp.]
MRKVWEAVGVLMVLQGAGGIVDHLGGSLWLGLFVVNRSGLFHGYEIFVNCILATLGVVLIALVTRSTSDRGPS